MSKKSNPEKSASALKRANKKRIETSAANAATLDKIGLDVDVKMPDGTTQRMVTRTLPYGYPDGHYDVGIENLPGGICCSRVTLAKGDAS